MNSNYRQVLILAAFSLIVGCSKNSAPKDSKETEHHEAEAQSSTTLSAEQTKSIGLTLGRLEKKQLTAVLRANGILKVPNQNRASISSPIGGIIKTIAVQAGQTVKAGQVIATLYNAEYVSMQEAFLTVRAQCELALSELTRQKNLSQASATATKNLQQAEMEWKTLSIRQASLKQQLDQLGANTSSLKAESIRDVMELRAALSGAVSSVLVNIGTHVSPSNPIVEIVDNSQLHLDLYVYEKDIAKISTGQLIHFTPTNNQGPEYDARIYSISNTFEPQSKAITVHARVEGKKDNLIEGTNVSAVISLQSALLDAVPSASIVNSQGQDFIFILADTHENDMQAEHDTNGKTVTASGHSATHNDSAVHANANQAFLRIPVRKGTTDVGYTEITPLVSLPSDARIVTNGAFFLLAKLTNSGESHEH